MRPGSADCVTRYRLNASSQRSNEGVANSFEFCYFTARHPSHRPIASIDARTYKSWIAYASRSVVPAINAISKFP